MARPSPPDPRPGLRCGRHTCPCRLPGAAVHCPVCRGPKPTLDVARRDGAWTLDCANRCRGDTIATAIRRLGLWPALYEARNELGVLATWVNDTGFGSRGRGTWYWYLQDHALSNVEACPEPVERGKRFDWEPDQLAQPRSVTQPLSVTLSEAKGLVPVRGAFG